MIKILFHAPYQLSGVSSGSQVRPIRILEAFLDLGYHVTVVSGSVPERKELIRNLRIQPGDFDLCYSEPSTYPVHPIWDYLFYIRIKQAGIPLGIYYRDAYWKIVPEWIPQGMTKKIILQLRYRIDLRLFNLVANVIYFPSQSLAELFRFPCKEILPPGAKKMFVESPLEKKSDTPNIIYVGNILPRYGLDLLFDMMVELNQLRNANLILICPAKNISNNPSTFSRHIGKRWLKIYHISGKELNNYYQNAAIGIIPRPINKYNNLAMPVKLFEYLSFGIPIVATNCKEMGNFIKYNRCGLAVQDNSTDLANAINYLVGDPEVYRRYASAARDTIINGNLWTDRAEKVVDTLSKP